MLASTLALYKNPEALRLIDQFLVDPELRRTYEEGRATLLKQKINPGESIKPKHR
jgi:hypothetical protein